MRMRFYEHNTSFPYIFYLSYRHHYRLSNFQKSLQIFAEFY